MLHVLIGRIPTTGLRCIASIRSACTTPGNHPARISKALESQPIAAIPFDSKMFGTAANNGQMIQQISARRRTTMMFLQMARSGSRRHQEAALLVLAPLMRSSESSRAGGGHFVSIRHHSPQRRPPCPPVDGQLAQGAATGILLSISACAFSFRDSRRLQLHNVQQHPRVGGSSAFAISASGMWPSRPSTIADWPARAHRRGARVWARRIVSSAFGRSFDEHVRQPEI